MRSRCVGVPGVGDGVRDVGGGAVGAAHPLGVADGIAAAVRCALERPARLGAVRLVAVDGPSGSGKTSLAGPLARALAEAIGGDVIRPERRSRPTLPGAHRASPGIASSRSMAPLDAAPPHTALPGRRPRVAVISTDLLATWEHPFDWWPGLEGHLLRPLAVGAVAALPVVEWVGGDPRPGGFVVLPPVEVLVLEGVSSGRVAVSDRLSALVWVEIADRATRLERSVARDGEASRPALARWQVDEDAHFAADRARDRADVLITAPD